MSIRFKFRSSVNFDAVEIGNRPSISIGELRAKILLGKVSQQQQQGFDLVFSDAVSGLEYKGDDSQIPSGSSVIIKRVPGGTVPMALLPCQAVNHVGMKESHNLNPANQPKDEFDVIGADLCPMSDSDFPDFDQEFDQNNFMGNKNDEVAGLRLEGGKKLDSSEPNNGIPGGSDQHGNDRKILPKVVEHLKLDKPPSSLVVQSTNLPLELKCSLCNDFFKDAVMIPCCQHSFCEKCIRLVLMEKGMCPKCFSSKCSVRDLLPNLSLRQAIEHFLESQLHGVDIVNDMQKYAPDGESGIQAKDVSCAVTVVQRELELPSSATGKKANQLDGVRGMHPRHNDMGGGLEDFARPGDFQGENQPVLPQSIVHDEADSNIKRKGAPWIDSGGGGRSFSSIGGYKKGVRNCYTCGSPDHLMRDCPMSHPNPIFQPGNGAFHGGMPGYAPPYWNGSSLPPFTPYANMYRNPTMMPFNASMVPVAPWAVSPYIPSMHSSLLSPGGNMRMGNMGPPRADHFGLQQCLNKRKHSNENLGREQHSDNKDNFSECFRHNRPEKSHDHKLQEDRESSLSHSDDNSLAQRLGKKIRHDKHMQDVHHADERHEKSHRSSSSGRDKGLSHAERSNSGKEDTCRSSDRHGEERHRSHRGDSTKYDERRGHYESDSSLGHRSAQKDVKRKVESDVHGSHKKHHNLSSESGLEPSTPVDRRGVYKERDSGHDSSRHSVKHSRERQRDGRWQTVSGADKDRRDDYGYNKRRAH